MQAHAATVSQMQGLLHHVSYEEYIRKLDAQTARKAEVPGKWRSLCGLPGSQPLGVVAGPRAALPVLVSAWAAGCHSLLTLVKGPLPAAASRCCQLVVASAPNSLPVPLVPHQGYRSQNGIRLRMHKRWPPNLAGATPISRFRCEVVTVFARVRPNRWKTRFAMVLGSNTDMPISVRK